MLEEVQAAADQAVQDKRLDLSCAKQLTGSFARRLTAYTYLVT